MPLCTWDVLIDMAHNRNQNWNRSLGFWGNQNWRLPLKPRNRKTLVYKIGTRRVLEILRSTLITTETEFVFVITAQQWYNWPRPHHTTGLIFTSQSKKPRLEIKLILATAQRGKYKGLGNMLYFGDMLYNLLPKYDKKISSVFLFWLITFDNPKRTPFVGY
jgi:hypothetical protein